jgi:hypothetical protein
MNMDFTLRDVSDEHTEKTQVSVQLEKDGLALLIGVQGYGEMTAETRSRPRQQDIRTASQAHPILLERFHGRLRLIVWGDINAEDPTHIIDLEPAREDARLLDCDGEFTAGELSRYIEQGGVRCMKEECGSDDLMCGAYETYDHGVCRFVRCNKCGREWRDELKLAGVTE